MAYVGKAPSTGRYSILDDISSSFTGSTAGPFNLTVNGTAISPGNEANCIISISGVVQDPIGIYNHRFSNNFQFKSLHRQILFLELC